MIKYKELLNNNKIKKHQTTQQEITELLQVVERDIKDGQITGLSDDRAYATLYNAALQLCTIIMAIEGYRTRSGSNHRTTFDFVELSNIAEISDYAIYFNKCRQKRNDVDYDRILVVSEQEKDEIIKYVQTFKKLVSTWLKDKF